MNKVLSKIKKKKADKEKIEENVLTVSNDIKKTEYVEGDEVYGTSGSFSSSEKVSKLLNFITMLGGGGLLFQIIQKFVTKFIQMIYQTNCSNFYKIPGEYFSTDVIEGLIKLIVAIFLVVFLFGYKKILKSLNKTDGLLYKIVYGLMDIAIGISYGYVILSSVINIVNYISIKKSLMSGIVLGFLSKHVYLVMIAVVILSVLTVLIINNMSLIKIIKNKYLRRVMYFMGVISFFITVYVFAASMIIGISKDVKNKTEYEIVTYNYKEYAVLNKDDDKYLLVEFCEDENHIILFTQPYKVVDIKGLDIRCKKLETIPTINTEVSKDEYIK